MSEKFIPYKTSYDKSDIKKINDVIELLTERGGVAYEVLAKSQLLKLKKSGLLDVDAWKENDADTQNKLKFVNLYPINTCLTVLKKEQLIRKYIDPEFSAESLDFSSLDEDALPFDNWDDHILKLLCKGEEDVFLVERDGNIYDAPECYRRLAYQTAHIKYHYAVKLKEILENESASTNETGAIGIALGKDAIYGAVCLSDGDIDIITPKNKERLVPLYSDAYTFDGFGSIWNPGVAVSEMGLQMRAIEKEYEKKYFDAVKSVTISMPALLPDREELEKAITDIEENAKQSPDKRKTYDILNAICLHNPTVRGLIEKATDFAGLENAELEVRALAVAKAYEHMDEDNKIDGFASALVYDWSNDYFSATLIDGGGHRNELCILNQCVIKNPIGNLNKPSDDENAFVNQLKNSMEKELNKFYIYNDSENEDIKASWEKFYSQTDKLAKQIMRNNYGTLLYEDYRANLVIDYPGKSFEKIFAPYYQQTENMVRKIFSEIKYPEYEICRVFLSGEWGNYPYVKKRLEQYFGRYVKVCTMDDTALAAVKGSAYLAKENIKKLNDHNEKSNSVENVKGEKKMGRRTIIPTFFKLSKTENSNDEKFVERKLVRKYDDNIKRQLNKSSKKKIVLDVGSVFNVYLRNLSSSSKVEYTYQSTEMSQDIIKFKLPEIEMNNRMLYMQLVAMDNINDVDEIKTFNALCDMKFLEEGANDEEKIKEFLTIHKDNVLGKVVFWKKDNKSFKKNKTNEEGSNLGKFICLKENYTFNWDKEHCKYLFATEEATNQHFVFKCWVEELPIPGKADCSYLFAYVDGSSKKENGQGVEEIYGAGAVLSDGKEIFLSHMEGEDKAANVIGEYNAARNMFCHFCLETENIEELRIYFDNNNVGYAPVGLYESDEIYTVNYMNSITEFQKRCPNINLRFEHVDAHTDIFGNEMADRVATVIDEIVNRDVICPADGSFSKSLKYVGA